jgi:predicted nucleic-acid-binding protein
MVAVLDTSVIVRYLTGDSPRLAARAARIIDSARTLTVTDVVIAETAYVLSSVYGVRRAAVVDSLVDLLQKRNVAILDLDKGAVLQALLLCRPSNRVFIRRRHDLGGRSVGQGRGRLFVRRTVPHRGRRRSNRLRVTGH